MSIGFWKKSTENFLTHSEGLNEEQIKFLQSLKVGDRLILWNNDSTTKFTPNLTLKYWRRNYDSESNGSPKKSA